MSTTYPGPETVRQRLDAELEIVPPKSCSCGVGDVDGDVIEFQQIRVDEHHHSDMIVSPGEGGSEGADGRVVHRQSPIHKECPFRAFYDDGWIPQVTGVTDGRVRVRVYLPDRDSLAGVIEDLERTATDFTVVKLRRIDREGVEGTSEEITFDLGELTEKQRATAVRAVETGYYDQPRGASLEQLAEEMGISKSALSQRLKSVETKFMKQAFDG